MIRPWSIRFDDSPLGPERRQIGYKSAREDPLYHVDNDLVTVDWRAAPVLRHEASLVGNSYECNPVKADMVVADFARGESGPADEGAVIRPKAIQGAIFGPPPGDHPRGDRGWSRDHERAGLLGEQTREIGRAHRKNKSAGASRDPAHQAG